jgi:hypothetical protein
MAHVEVKLAMDWIVLRLAVVVTLSTTFPGSAYVGKPLSKSRFQASIEGYESIDEIVATTVDSSATVVAESMPDHESMFVVRSSINRCAMTT